MKTKTNINKSKLLIDREFFALPRNNVLYNFSILNTTWVYFRRIRTNYKIVYRAYLYRVDFSGGVVSENRCECSSGILFYFWSGSFLDEVFHNSCKIDTGVGWTFPSMYCINHGGFLMVSREVWAPEGPPNFYI